MADNVTPSADFQAPMGEFGIDGGSGNPAGPADSGENTRSPDADFIMDTLFGSDTDPSGGQEKAATPSSATPGGSTASPPAAPAATGTEVNPPATPAPGTSATPQQLPQAAPAGGQPVQTPGQEPVSSPVATPPAAPELTIEDRLKLASVDALQQQNQQLLARLDAIEKGTQPQGQPGQPPQQPAQPGADEHVRLVVPDQLAGAIFGEDPVQAKEAMNLLISGVATNAARVAVERATAIIDQRLAAAQQGQAAATEANQQEDAYYSKFPAHKNELYRPVIQATVDQLYKELPGLPWNDTTMDAIGARVNTKLQSLGINPTTVAVPPTTPAAQVPAAPKPQGPAPMLDTSTRVATPVDAGDFIKNTFGG